MKITIISSTNRPNAISLQVAQQYHALLSERNVNSTIIDLGQLPSDFIESALYKNAGKHDDVNKYIEILKNTDKYVFIVPEYNGSFPGVLKLFLDGMPYPSPFINKKCALVGLSSGTQGAGLALSHLTDIFNYMGMHVLAIKPRLARIEGIMTDGKITDKFHLNLINDQINTLLEF